tara:strand:- start:60 stop:305 length:246 start_codon:yes stop_codon:yes gene_type:complete
MELDPWGVAIGCGVLAFFLAGAWNKIKKLQGESEDHFKQIDDLGNQVAGLKRELEEKKVISWEQEKFDKDLAKHIEEISKE